MQGAVVDGIKQQGNGVIHVDLQVVGQGGQLCERRRPPNSGPELKEEHAPEGASSKRLLRCTKYLRVTLAPTIRCIAPGAAARMSQMRRPFPSFLSASSPRRRLHPHPG